MNSKALRGRPAALIAAGGVLAIAIGGFAAAAIPSSNGTIHGCYLKSGVAEAQLGGLRLIDPTKTSCTSRETAISWNQKGQPGPPGSTGPSGPPGPTADTSALLARLDAAESNYSSQADRLAAAESSIASLQEQIDATKPGTLTLTMTPVDIGVGGPAFAQLSVVGVRLQPGAQVVEHEDYGGSTVETRVVGVVDANGRFGFDATTCLGGVWWYTAVNADGDPVTTQMLQCMF